MGNKEGYIQLVKNRSIENRKAIEVLYERGLLGNYISTPYDMK